VESSRRKGKEELHPALKWDWTRGTVGGFSVRRSISGCALFVDLEPRLCKGVRTQPLSPGCGLSSSSKSLESERQHRVGPAPMHRR